jgi:hypothetical protein
MKVPETLELAFGKEFEEWITSFSVEKGLLPDADSLQSVRFLARSVVPHIEKLSLLFNRDQKEQQSGLAPYWTESSNPTNLRLAYFLYFMPSNLFRTASVWAELSRLGYSWPSQGFKAIEFGAGPASGACGIAAGERYAPVGLPHSGNWALIEQDRAMLELGAEWAQTYLSHLGMKDFGIRTFHRKIDPSQGFLPRAAPKFHLWLMSYYLNETEMPASDLAPLLLKNWERHLEEEGLVILIEPALKLQSRRLLELRKELLIEKEKQKADWLQILLPCMGHQSCGALANPEDWCHEEVSWWRPPYFRTLDKMAKLDRKSLPFSYLVLTKSNRKREEILPALKDSSKERRYRLVSPAHSEGKDLEFFLCGQDGKRRARYRPPSKEDSSASINRGSILTETDLRGDAQASRVEKIKKVL